MQRPKDRKFCVIKNLKESQQDWKRERGRGQKMRSERKGGPYRPR